MFGSDGFSSRLFAFLPKPYSYYDTLVVSGEQVASDLDKEEALK